MCVILLRKLAGVFITPCCADRYALLKAKATRGQYVKLAHGKRLATPGKQLCAQCRTLTIVGFYHFVGDINDLVSQYY